MIQTDCSSSVVPVTHNVLLKAFLDSNKVDDALHLVNVMLSEGFIPDKDCFTELVTALCAHGRMDETVSVYIDIVVKHPESDFHLDNHIPFMIMTQLINAGKYC
jgi:pentatricopeptide repeat protein